VVLRRAGFREVERRRRRSTKRMKSVRL